MNTDSEFKINQNKLFFKLKNHNVVQSALINTILIKYNCSIEYLAHILHVDDKKLNQVWKSNEVLSEPKANDLVSLFYVLVGNPI